MVVVVVVVVAPVLVLVTANKEEDEEEGGGRGEGRLWREARKGRRLCQIIECVGKCSLRWWVLVLVVVLSSM